MDDRLAQFLIAVDELCTAASLAGLDVELRERGTGTMIARGVPHSPSRMEAGRDGDDTGCAPVLVIDDRFVDLERVGACTIYPPAAAPQR